MNTRGLVRWLVLCLALGSLPLVAVQSHPAPLRPPLVLMGDTDYPPMSYLDGGVPKGIDVDIAMALGRELGREVRVELMDWDVAQARVLRGDGDGLLSMSASPERAHTYDFTDAIGAHDFGIFVRSGDLRIRGVGDLVGKRVAVTPGGLPRRLLPGTGADFALMRNYPEGLHGLESGKIDAVAADIWVASHTIERQQLRNIVTAGPPFASVPAGIAVRKGNTALLAEINQAIGVLRTNGTLTRIQAHWRPQEMLFMSRGRLNGVVAIATAAFFVVLALAGMLLRKQLRIQSERRTAEAKAHLLARGLQSANDCISITDTSDRILYVNEAFLQTYEYEEEELIGRHIDVVRAFDNPPGVGDAIATATKQDGWRGVIGNRSKNGRVFPVSRTTSTVYDESGAAIAAVGVARDMTDEAAVAQALRTSEERYRDVVESANDIIFTIDRDGYCLSMNRAGREITGYVADDSRGINLRQLVVPEQADVATQQLRRVLSGEAVQRFEIDIFNKSGARLTLELDVRPVWTGDRITGVQGIARDVTARKELEAQLVQSQKLEAIGRLAGGVAHDFNNILTVVMGFAELAAEQLESSHPARRDIEEIQRAAESAASLTRQLLIFSRKNIVHPTVIALDEIVRRLDKMLRRLVGEHIEFIVRPEYTLGHVRADAAQIEQVVMNLVVNARDAMPSGGILTIETNTVLADDAFVRVHSGSSAGEYVRLTVTDTGQGMSAEVRAQIFMPFFTTKGPDAGTGLGLATVYRIVQQAGGFITVDSAPGHGTSFDVYLPTVDAPVDQAGESTDLAVQPLTSGTVLLAEDDERIRTLGSRALRRLGYTVLPARDAEEAKRIAASESGRIDLLLTDVVMPGLTGRELAEELRRTRPELKVLYTSGYTADSATLVELEKGNVAFIQKPYTPLALAQRVREVLEGQVH